MKQNFNDQRREVLSRRLFMARSAVVGSAMLVGAREAAEASTLASQHHADGVSYKPVVTPNGTALPVRIVDDTKVFHLTAEPVSHEFAPGMRGKCWGYNGGTPGPTMEVVEGDCVRIYVTNRLPAPTTIHWHGVILPNGMDGVGGLNQPYIRPGETFRYEFKFIHPGTYMYHPHVDEMTQIGMGLMGMIVVHERNPSYTIDRDFAIMLSEWMLPVGTHRPDPREMTDFNVLTFNSKAFPGTDPLVVRTGQRVRIRFGNLSAMHNHPIHLHGYSFRTTRTDGGRIEKSAQWPETTVVVPVGATRDIEFVANAQGDWAMHCHFTHHIMNQMGHEGPNMIGIDSAGLNELIRPLLPGYMTMGESGMAGMREHEMHSMKGMTDLVPENSAAMSGMQGKHDYIDMGGMFAVLKVRDEITTYEDPGWYDIPEGTMARRASIEELESDGIYIPKSEH